MGGHVNMQTGQLDMDMREIGLDRAYATDKLVELSFHTFQTRAHVTKKREDEIFGLLGHNEGKIGPEDDRVKCDRRRILQIL